MAEERKRNAIVQPFVAASASVTRVTEDGTCTIRGPLDYVVRELKRLLTTPSDVTRLFNYRTPSSFNIEADGVLPFEVYANSVEIAVVPSPSDIFALTCACLLKYSAMQNLRLIDMQTAVAPYLVNVLETGDIRNHREPLHVQFTAPPRAGLEAGYIVRAMMALARSAPGAGPTHVVIQHKVGTHTVHPFLLEMWVVATRDFLQASHNDDNSIVHDFGAANAHELYFSRQCTSANLAGLNWCTISDERITFPRGSLLNGLAHYTAFWTPHRWGNNRTLQMRSPVPPTDGRASCTYKAIVPLRGRVSLDLIESKEVSPSVRGLVTPLLRYRDLDNVLTLDVTGDLTGMTIVPTDVLSISELVIHVNQRAPLRAVQLLNANPTIRSLQLIVRNFVPLKADMTPAAELLSNVTHLETLKFKMREQPRGVVPMQRQDVCENLNDLVSHVCSIGGLKQLKSVSLHACQGSMSSIRSFFMFDLPNDRPLLREVVLHFDASITSRDIERLFVNLDKKPQFRQLQSLMVSFEQPSQAPAVALLMRQFGTHLLALTQLRVDLAPSVFGRAAFLPDAARDSMGTAAERAQLVEHRAHARTLANAVRDIANECRLQQIWLPIEMDIAEVVPMLHNPEDPAQFATRAPMFSLRLMIHPRVTFEEKSAFLGLLGSLRNSMRDLQLPGNFMQALEREYEFDMASNSVYGHRDFRAAELTATGHALSELNLDEFDGGNSLFARHVKQLLEVKEREDAAVMAAYRPVRRQHHHHHHPYHHQRDRPHAVDTLTAYQALQSDQCVFHRLLNDYLHMRIHRPVLVPRLADALERKAYDEVAEIRKQMGTPLWNASEDNDPLTQFRLRILQRFHNHYGHDSIAYMFDLLEDSPNDTPLQLGTTGACLHDQDLTVLRILCLNCCSNCNACMSTNCFRPDHR